MKIIQLRRKRVNEIAARCGILRIAAVHGVSGEDRRITKIFESTTAIGTGSVYTADPGNTDTRAERQLGGGAVDNIPDNLVPGNERFLSRGQLALHDVEIGTADSAGANPKKDLTGCGLRRGSLFNVKRLFRGSEDSGFQRLNVMRCLAEPAHRIPRDVIILNPLKVWVCELAGRQWSRQRFFWLVDGLDKVIQEEGCARPIGGAVIAGQRERHHRPDCRFAFHGDHAVRNAAHR